MERLKPNLATILIVAGAVVLGGLALLQNFPDDRTPQVTSGSPLVAQQDADGEAQEEEQEEAGDTEEDTEADTGEEEETTDDSEELPSGTEEPADSPGTDTSELAPPEGRDRPGVVESPAETVRGSSENWEYIPIPVNPIEMDQDSIDQGNELFVQNCIGCHGRLAEGKGPVYLSLDPRPRNLGNEHWLRARPDGWLFLQIQNGVPGSAMPPWGATFSEKEIWHIINWIKNNAGVERNSDIAR